MLRRCWVLAVLATVTLLALTEGAQAAEWDGHSAGDNVNVEGRDHSGGGRGEIQIDPNVQYKSSDSCRPDDEVRVLITCANGRIQDFTDCPDGESLPPRWMRVRDDEGSPWGPWMLLSTFACPGEPGYPTVTERDLRSLQIAAPPISVQPPNGWTLTGVDTVFFTRAAPQRFRVALLGYPVDVEVTPGRYSWDFGDWTAPLETTRPGAPWPHATITHAYRAAGSVVPRLTSTWHGRFRVVGHRTWQAVTGTATTTSTAPGLEVFPARTHRVVDPLP